MDELAGQICDKLNREDAMIGGNGVSCSLVRAVLVELTKTHAMTPKPSNPVTAFNVTPRREEPQIVYRRTRR